MDVDLNITVEMMSSIVIKSLHAQIQCIMPCIDCRP